MLTKEQAWNVICSDNFYDTDHRKMMRNKLIDTMMDNTPILNWMNMEVINPYFVYHLTGSFGLPIEYVQDLLEKEGVEWVWTDWCEHWYKSFCTIPIKLLRC